MYGNHSRGLRWHSGQPPQPRFGCCCCGGVTPPPSFRPRSTCENTESAIHSAPPHPGAAEGGGSTPPTQLLTWCCCGGGNPPQPFQRCCCYVRGYPPFAAGCEFPHVFANVQKATPVHDYGMYYGKTATQLLKLGVALCNYRMLRFSEPEQRTPCTKEERRLWETC